MNDVDWMILSWPALILFGLGLRMALRLMYGARGPDPNDPVHGYLTIVSWVLIVIGSVPIVSSPESGTSRPAMRRSNVDLPQPLGPINATNSPAANESDTFCNAARRVSGSSGTGKLLSIVRTCSEDAASTATT